MCFDCGHVSHFGGLAFQLFHIEFRRPASVAVFGYSKAVFPSNQELVRATVGIFGTHMSFFDILDSPRYREMNRTPKKVVISPLDINLFAVVSSLHRTLIKVA